MKVEKRQVVIEGTVITLDGEETELLRRILKGSYRIPNVILGYTGDPYGEHHDNDEWEKMSKFISRLHKELWQNG